MTSQSLGYFRLWNYGMQPTDRSCLPSEVLNIAVLFFMARDGVLNAGMSCLSRPCFLCCNHSDPYFDYIFFQKPLIQGFLAVISFPMFSISRLLLSFTFATRISSAEYILLFLLYYTLIPSLQSRLRLVIEGTRLLRKACFHLSTHPVYKHVFLLPATQDSSFYYVL